MPVLIKCKVCQKDFHSPIQFDKASFEEPSNTITGLSTNCSNCGQAAVYDKSDMFFSE